MRNAQVLVLAMVVLIGCEQSAAEGGSAGATAGWGVAGASSLIPNPEAGSGGQVQRQGPSEQAAGGRPASVPREDPPGMAGAGGAGIAAAGGRAGGAAGEMLAAGAAAAAAGSGGGGGATVQSGGAEMVDPFTGMCSSARWSHVSPACWSCWCGECAESLNAATRKSLEIFECMFEQKLLVNDLFELVCEVNAGQAECVDGATDDWDKLVAFDTCLMANATAPAFRACEAECEIDYPGDVCTRYP
jgi:hypothetical protein